MPILERINITPVKGMALVHPEQVEITPHGVKNDRRFYLVDEHGTMLTGFDHGPLVQIGATYDHPGQSLELRFPGGQVVAGPVDRLGAPAVTDFYGRSVPAKEVEGPWSEAISAHVGRPVRLLMSDREGDGLDEFPVTVISRASVDDLAERGKHEGPLDSRRFRITFELAGCEPYEEDSWDGRSVEIGEAEVLISGAIPRCVTTTQDPDTGRKDWDTLTQIAKYRPRIPDGGGLPFGMYGTVVRPGVARQGDTVQVRSLTPST